MEVTFAVLLWGVRIAFLVLLYLFLIRAFRALQHSLGEERVHYGDEVQVGRIALRLERVQ